MEIAAVTAVAKSLRAREAHLSKAPVVHVVDIAEQRAQLRAAVLHARIVPEAPRDPGVKEVAPVGLCALPQVGSPHDAQKHALVYGKEPGNDLHARRGSMLLRCHHVHHVAAHELGRFLAGGNLLIERLEQRDARENRLLERLHLIFRLAGSTGDELFEKLRLTREQLARRLLAKPLNQVFLDIPLLFDGHSATLPFFARGIKARLE